MPKQYDKLLSNKTSELFLCINHQYNVAMCMEFSVIGITNCFQCTNTNRLNVNCFTIHWPNVSSMLAHRLRRWPNINPSLGQRGMLTHWPSSVVVNKPTQYIVPMSGHIHLSSNKPIRHEGWMYLICWGRWSVGNRMNTYLHFALQSPLTLKALNIFLYKPWIPKGLIQFEIIRKVLVSSFWFIWIPMLWGYGH